MEINYHFLDQDKSYRHHDSSRSAFQEYYANLLALEPALGRRVLDIGCGHGTNPTIERISNRLGEVDGVDPFPIVAPHPLIRQRWTCRLEDLPVGDGTYDMAYSYNVVEHVDNVGSFLKKVSRVVKPGGVYWSMSPNAAHPFAKCVRLMQFLRLKKSYRASISPFANDYPAFYRMCSDVSVLRAIKNGQIGVARIDFYYIHCVQWDSFFPKGLRFVARVFDKAYILKRPKMANIFMFRLQLEQ